LTKEHLFDIILFAWGRFLASTEILVFS